MDKKDILKPSVSILCKLGSLFIHIEEVLSKEAHEFDIAAIKQILNDEEVKEWILEMDKLALITKKR